MAKYNTLTEFRKHIEKSYSNATATTYFHTMAKLLEDQNIIDCRDMDITKVLEKLQATKHKNDFSKQKNAFTMFCSFIDIKLDPVTLQAIENMNDSKQKKLRQLKPVTLSHIDKEINIIQDSKLKLSFLTMKSTGLRVSELSQISKEGSTFHDDYIQFEFIGKGGNKETVKVVRREDVEHFNNLIKLIDSTESGKKLFYSSSYLQKEAKKRGFQSHDLRRVYAKQVYGKTKNQKTVKKQLRHKKIKNTQIYLKSKVDIDK